MCIWIFHRTSCRTHNALRWLTCSWHKMSTFFFGNKKFNKSYERLRSLDEDYIFYWYAVTSPKRVSPENHITLHIKKLIKKISPWSTFESVQPNEVIRVSSIWCSVYFEETRKRLPLKVILLSKLLMCWDCFVHITRNNELSSHEILTY